LAGGAPPTFLTFPGHSFTPGCYSTISPYNTYCIPEPPDPGITLGWVIDGLGDRLAYRLAYRYVTGTTTGEYLAVTHTVQEANTTDGRTGIRYYKILAGTNPQAVLVGDIQDGPQKTYFYSMPSVAMDKNGNLGITYTQTGNVGMYNYDPSPFFVTVDSSGNQGTPVAILGSNSGSTGVDGTDSNWGEYVSVNTDPDDDLTFWAVDEYMNGPQIPNPQTTCSLTSGFGKNCTWASRIFTCQKGNGC
jgi:hypothetical protein